MMKISYEEFNKLQEQQSIRDSASQTIGELRYLNSIVKRDHNKKINEMIKYLSEVEHEAIDIIANMVEGSER